MLQVNETKLVETSKPADFSYKNLKSLQAVGLEMVRSSRLGTIPTRGRKRNKFLTRSIWLNNNKLRSTQNLNVFVDTVLEYPDQLSWMDFSFNQIAEIDRESLLRYPLIKILYFHGNCIDNLEEVLKLRPLKHLRTVTFQGNPISNYPNYRSYVIAALPQIFNLDFTGVTAEDKLVPKPPELLKHLKQHPEIPSL